MSREGGMQPPRFPCPAHSVTPYLIGYEAVVAKAAVWPSVKVDCLIAFLLGKEDRTDWDGGVIDGLADILIERGAVDTINRRLGFRT